MARLILMIPNKERQNMDWDDKLEFVSPTLTLLRDESDSGIFANKVKQWEVENFQFT